MAAQPRILMVFTTFLLAQPLIILFSISIGSLAIPFTNVIDVLVGGFRGDDVASTVIWNIRLPRTITAALGGAGLAVAGVMLQVFFRNPLADPYILGIASGSSLFVALAILAGFTFGMVASPYDPYFLFTASFLGAAAVSALIIMLSSVIRSITTLLVAGLMISYLASALTSILQYLADIERVRAFVFWVLGSFAGAKWIHITPMTVAIIAGVVASLFLAKPFNALLLSDDYARSLGVRIRLVRLSAIAITALLTSSVTVVAGPIGFVGLAVPYLARLAIQSSDNRLLIPLSALLGSTVTVAADMAARTLLAPIELPVSAITALFGVPIVIMLLIRRGSL